MVESQAAEKQPAVIKKYANRRLYDTTTAQFVTLETLRKRVADGEEFVVRDARTGTDITASILAQIVANQGSKGEDLLPIDLLRQVISLYDRGMGGYLSAYLDKSMEVFARNWGPMQQMGELGRRNVELFQRSLGIMMPGTPAAGADAAAPGSEDDDATQAELSEQVRDLRAQLEEMQRRLDTLTRRRGEGS
jgi:polyhydroxyalkanoate synthesis repressor PhaR